MRKTGILLLLTLVSIAAFGQHYRVATYNVRLKNDNDIGNLWTDRYLALSGLIAYHEFDIFGTQEGFESQINDIQRELPQYSRYGVGRDDGKNAGEHSAIFFLKNKFKLLRSGDFWLSQTPDIPSKGWDAKCCNRLVSWIQLMDKNTKRKFFIFNAHYDHEGEHARQESSKLVLQKIKEITGNNPVIFMGDLNGSYDTACYQILEKSSTLKDSHNLSPLVYEPNGSFNGFKNPPTGKNLIDHIFVSKDFKIKKWGLLTDTYQGKFPSDHFPVMVSLSL